MAGFPAVDNGFARFDHLRVPRVNMLSKFSQVTKEGGYVRPPHAKLNYGVVSTLFYCWFLNQ